MSSIKKRIKLFIIILAILISTFIIRVIIITPQAHISPSYDKQDITNIINKSTLNDDDYKTIFHQTGLGKIPVDKLISEGDTGKEKILTIQDKFFDNIKVKSEMITPVTFQESVVNDENKYIYGTELAPLENGYILVSRGTHSLGWRHGHAAIVVNAEKSEILEAAVLGQNSQIGKADRFRMYPNFMILKLKGVSQDELDNIAKYAYEKLYNVPYRLTCGLFGTKYTKGSSPKGTQCSHLVWYPFMEFGYDLDSDGGWLVTPKDIANSPYVEVVQVYGFNVDKLWD